MNIYLDIDGVLLAHSRGASYFADDFIQFVLRHFADSTYWLTTHCWQGQNRAVDVLAPYLKTETAELLSRIKPTEWQDLKTDGINFSQPFFWYDDDLYPEEQAVLEHYNAMQCLRRINLLKDPHQLMDEIVFLKKFVKH